MDQFETGWRHQTARIAYALNLHKQFLRKLEAWLESRETTNFTYDLEPNNLNHLAGFVATVCGLPLAQAEQYVGELARCDLLKAVVRDITRETDLRFVADADARPGRRIGWYALVRARRSKTVVELGVDKGLGSCVLAEALRQNRAEGHPGRLLAIDIDPAAGLMLRASEYAEFGEFVASDSIAFLQSFPGAIDLLVSDSDHSPDYEEREYEAARPKMSADGIIVADNAHGTDVLYRYAKKYGKRFLFFHERPLNHIYPGAGIGVCF